MRPPPPLPGGDPRPTASTALATRGDTAAAMVAAGFIGRDVASYPLFHQREVADNNNACGTTALAMVLASEGLIGRDLASAIAVDKDVRLRRLDIGTPGIDLVHAARDAGLHANLLNNSSFDELRDQVASGNHVMAMIQTSEPHWVNVVGIRQEGDREILSIADPARGAIREIDRAEFEAQWQRPFAGEGPFIDGLLGTERQMIVMGRDKDTIPDGRSGRAASIDSFLDGATDLSKIVHSVKEGRFGAAIGNLLSGVVQVPLALPGALGSVVVGAGDQLKAWGRGLKDSDNGAARAAGSVVDVAGAAVSGVGSVVRGAGNALSAVGRGIAGPIKGLFGIG
jgi:hypothetical protein